MGQALTSKLLPEELPAGGEGEPSTCRGLRQSSAVMEGACGTGGCSEEGKSSGRRRH